MDIRSSMPPTTTPDARRQPRPGDPSDRGVLARLVPGVAPGRSTATWRMGRGRRERRPAVRPDASSCSTRTAAASPSRRLPAARCRRHRRHGDRDEERRHRHARCTTGRATAARPAVARDGHLRGPRAGASRADPSSGVPAELRGTYAGFIEKIPYLVDLGHHRGRAAAGLRVRRAGGAGRPPELLGLPAGLVLRAARRLRSQPGPTAAARRVPRPGQGAPPGRARGHPRRRLQPHRRGRRGRPDVRFRGLANDDYYLLDPQDRATTPTTAAPATRSTPTARSSAG